MDEQTGTKSRRADATRNRDAIIDAALRCLNANPRASVAEIAAAAGVSRITLYGHFSSREDLLNAAFTRTIDRVEAELAGVPMDGDPWPTLEALLQKQWRLVAELSGMVQASEHRLTDERRREFHSRPIARVRALLEAGRADGSFRTDHPLGWQLACFFAVLHGAAGELREHRLSEEEAARVIPESIGALLRP
jgi:TetR/AcrR family transcriptional repressor of mexCD-oprJ operon